MKRAGTAANGRAIENVTLSELYEMAKRDPAKTFDDWPITEIRLKCLKAMEKQIFDKRLADWAEKRILYFFDFARSRELGGAILERYVFNAQDVVRAIEFALCLDLGKKACPFFSCCNFDGYADLENIVSKVVAGRLFKGETINSEPFIIPLRKFLGKFLDTLTLPWAMSGGIVRYADSDWVCAERALRIIVANKDLSFLPKVEEYIRLSQGGKIQPPDKLFYTKGSHLAAFEETRRILLEAQATKAVT